MELGILVGCALRSVEVEEHFADLAGR